MLDGQQRLTAMYYAFMAPDVPAPSRANRFLYFIRVDRFMEEAYDEAFEYDWTRTGEKTLGTDLEQYEKHMFPLAVVGRGDRAVVKWSTGYEEHWKSREAAALNAGDAAGAAIARTSRRKRAAVRQASGRHHAAVPDLVHRTRPGAGARQGLRHLHADQQPGHSTRRLRPDQRTSQAERPAAQAPVARGGSAPGLRADRADERLHPPGDVHPSASLLLAQVPLLPAARPGEEGARGRRLAPQGSAGSRYLPSSRRAGARRSKRCERAIDLLRHPQEFGAISSQYLPYVSILPVFAALQVAARSLPAIRQLDAQRKSRHWYWASVFTNRYSGSVESTSARDYLDVKAWFDDDVAEPALIGEFRGRFKALDLRRETKRGSSVYNGIFNLLVLRGARDWMTGTVPQYGDLDDHHIVPKSWGKEHGARQHDRFDPESNAAHGRHEPEGHQ